MAVELGQADLVVVKGSAVADALLWLDRYQQTLHMLWQIQDRKRLQELGLRSCVCLHARTWGQRHGHCHPSLQMTPCAQALA
jgi:hypothetical protein